MSLNLEDLLEVEVDDLDWTWSVTVSNTCKDGSASFEELDLRDIDTSFVVQHELSIYDGLDRLINTSSVNDALWVWLIINLWMISNTWKLEILDGETESWVHVLGVIFISIKIPSEDVTIPTTWNETRVIIEPLEASDWTKMCFVDHILSVLTCVEFVHINVTLRCASEQVTTVRESDFSASLDWNSVVRLETLLEDIHHSDSISETDNQVETWWMEGYTVGLIWVLLADLKNWWVGVVPNSDRLISRASNNEVLLDADIHTLDGSWMEWANKILILGIILRSFWIGKHSHQLVVLSWEDDVVFRAGKGHVSDSWWHDTSLKIMVLTLLITFFVLWKLGNLVVWVLWIFRFLINHNLTVITSNDETFLIGLDALNIEIFTWSLIKTHLVVTTGFKKHDFTLVCANKKSSIW